MHCALATSMLMRGRRMFEHPGAVMSCGLLSTVHVAPASWSSLSVDITWISRVALEPGRLRAGTRRPCSILPPPFFYDSFEAGDKNFQRQFIMPEQANISRSRPLRQVLPAPARRPDLAEPPASTAPSSRKNMVPAACTACRKHKAKVFRGDLYWGCTLLILVIMIVLRRKTVVPPLCPKANWMPLDYKAWRDQRTSPQTRLPWHSKQKVTSSGAIRACKKFVRSRGWTRLSKN